MKVTGKRNIRKKVELKEFLNSNDTRIQVSEPEFYDLKKEAIEKAKIFDYQVVVVDFADPENLFAQDFTKRHDIGREHEGERVLFFHENVNDACSVNILNVGSAYADSAGHYERRHHKVITSFDLRLMAVEQNAAIVSTYQTRFSGYGQTPFQINREEINEEIIKEIETLGGLNGKGHLLNIVGKPRTGKTTTLRLLSYHMDKNGKPLEYPESARAYEKAKYNNMQEMGAHDAATCYILRKQNEGSLLLLDEAGLVKAGLHDCLAGEYNVLVYASHRKVPFKTDSQFKLKKFSY